MTGTKPAQWRGSLERRKGDKSCHQAVEYRLGTKSLREDGEEVVHERLLKIR